MEHQRLGKYVLVRLLGAGGMGEVYLARVEGVGGFSREVAIKIVPPSAIRSPKAIERFLREGRLLASLSHRNIIGVFDLDTADDQPFLVMEYLRGVDLRSVLHHQAGPLPWAAAAFIGAEVSRALTAAHGLTSEDLPRGIIHGDLSPANVMLCFDGAVKVLDFGLARACGAEVTSAGIRGKLPYLPPESLAGVALDHRADIYALGVTLYRCLTGRMPHEPTNDPEVMLRAQRARVHPPTELVDELPPPIERAVLQALVPDRGQRLQRADELAEALEAALEGRFGPPDLTRLLEDLGLAEGHEAASTMEWHPPTPGPSQTETASAVVAGVPPELATTVAGGLRPLVARGPAERRPASSALAAKHSARRRRGLLGGALAATLLVVATLVIVFTGEDQQPADRPVRVRAMPATRPDAALTITRPIVPDAALSVTRPIVPDADRIDPKAVHDASAAVDRGSAVVSLRRPRRRPGARRRPRPVARRGPAKNKPTVRRARGRSPPATTRRKPKQRGITPGLLADPFAERKD